MPSKTCVLSEEDANKLKCSICNGYLSVGPVKSSVDGTHYQCGRCNFNVPDINVIINFTYEKLAQYAMFPCINVGCKDKILWENVEEHEMMCAFRKIKCPKLDCEHILGSSEMVSHFQELHKDLITPNMVAVIWQLLEPQDFSLGMLIHNEMPYIYLISQDPHRLRVSVYSFKNTVKEKYKLNLSTPTGIEISIHGGMIVPYDDRKHCIKCFSKTCTSKLHKFSTNYGNEYEMTTELEVAGIESVLKSNVTYCELFIETKEKKKNFDNSNIIRKTIECPICKNYMLPPIYNCGTGHIVCKTCKKDLSKCPTCQANFNEKSRNYTVEELSENVSLPCQNNNEGCKFIGNPKTLQLHEDICRLARK